MRALALVFTLLTANEEYSRFITAASRLFENLEYERALEQLDNAKKLAKTADEQTEVALYEGVVLLELGRTDDAKAALQTALFLSPDAKLPVKVSPKVAQQVEGIRAKVKQELAPILARREAEAQIARLKEEAERKRKAEEEAKARAAAEAAKEKPPPAVAKVEPLPPPKVEPKLEPQPEPTVEAAPPVIVEQPQQTGPRRKGVPIVALVFVALGAGSGITGAIFGSQSQSLVALAESEMTPHADAPGLLEQARPKALIANVMFAVTGALVLGAVISAIVWAASE